MSLHFWQKDGPWPRYPLSYLPATSKFHWCTNSCRKMSLTKRCVPVAGQGLSTIRWPPNTTRAFRVIWTRRTVVGQSPAKPQRTRRSHAKGDVRLLQACRKELDVPLTPLMVQHRCDGSVKPIGLFGSEARKRLVPHPARRSQIRVSRLNVTSSAPRLSRRCQRQYRRGWRHRVGRVLVYGRSWQVDVTGIMTIKQGDNVCLELHFSHIGGKWVWRGQGASAKLSSGAGLHIRALPGIYTWSRYRSRLTFRETGHDGYVVC